MTVIGFRPLGKRVLLKRLDQEESIGGILVPDSHKKKQDKAKVLALGIISNEEAYSFSLKIDDIVFIDKYAGENISLNDEDYIVVQEENILGVLS